MTGTNNFVNAGNTGVCQVCHTTTQYFRKDGSNPGGTHVDVSTNCLDCHKHNPTTGTAFTPGGGCNACHGYPPAPRQTAFGVTFGNQGQWSSARFEDYSGGGGAHLVAAHIPKNLSLTGTAADWTPCLPCHFGADASHARTLPVRTHVSNVTVKIDPQYRFSGDYFTAYTTAKLNNDGTNVTGTCFNVSCHLAPSPKWSTER
jgi:hypothetical protein